MGSGYGYGKAIFFGEHFVIYNVPGIVAALKQAAVARVERRTDGKLDIIDRRAGALGYTEKKKAQQLESLARICRHLGMESSGMRIELSGNLPTFSGIGASGASSVAIVRAISEEFDLDLTDQKVNTAAHEAEKAYHGERTAGLDNVASTFGGFIYFTCIKPLHFEKLKTQQPIDIVMADTGVVANTKDMIEGVAHRREQSPGAYESIFAEARLVIEQARQAVERFDLDEVGKLMNENHRLLQAIKVTCPELDHLVELARTHGALGAKQTGAGGGGCILALTPGKERQDAVADALRAEGFAVLKTTVGGSNGE